MEIMLITVLAAAIDMAAGDPPDAFHPVAWMGKVIGWLERFGLRLGRRGQLIYGAAMTIFVTGLFVTPVYFLLFYLRDWSLAAYIIAAAILLKSTFAIRGLRQAAVTVRRQLESARTDEARFELRALVSRNTAALDEPKLVSSAVESVAEGTGDSLVAPLFYFLLLGVPGAIGYRVVNTLDAMIGYHGRYERLGKFAARLDDVLNFIPARIAALLLVLAACLTGRSGRNAWQTAQREHRRTESPNAGWPMAAMAGALGVRLEKTGHYRLGDGGAALETSAINSAVRLFLFATAAWLLVCLAVGVIRFAVTA